MNRGPGPAAACTSSGNCPLIAELPSGDYAVVGYEPSPETWLTLPAGVSVGDGERLVVVPRGVTRAFLTGLPAASIVLPPEIQEESMLTVSGVCTCARCEQHGGCGIYRMVGSCYNCTSGPILMLFRAGDRVAVLPCPRCGVRDVHAKRAATDDEVPDGEPASGADAESGAREGAHLPEATP